MRHLFLALCVLLSPSFVFAGMFSVFGSNAVASDPFSQESFYLTYEEAYLLAQKLDRHITVLIVRLSPSSGYTIDYAAKQASLAKKQNAIFAAVQEDDARFEPGLNKGYYESGVLYWEGVFQTEQSVFIQSGSNCGPRG